MKVRVEFTVDIDPEAWEENYGVSGAAAIRKDVRTYIKGDVLEGLRDLGLLRD